ncbi:MAG: penicillin-binding protein [Spirochaetaceae bacterium]|jgi:cell division protein FtsI (penicillin-binding protein 3)|nr:penicillin-binding protein [Spirochaetaceae bacterium]
MDDKKSISRWIILFAALSAVTIYIVFRYGEIMLGGGGGAPLRRQISGAERGAIVDRNGRILAIEAQFGDVGAAPSKIRNVDEFAQLLAPLLEMDAKSIKERVNSSSEFVYIKKKVDRAHVRAIEALIAEKKLSGVTVDAVRGRVYPEESLAAQIIGFTGDGNRGLEGIEFAFDNDLRVQIAANGESVGGNSVVLTIDANIQHFLEEIAQKAITEHNAESVLLTAMDPRSGEILGAASLPSFNPNRFGESDRSLWAFRPAVWSYEPGSVFKVFSIAALLDERAIDSATTFYCNGAYENVMSSGERVVIKCLGAHGRVNARDIIMYSCNAGAGYAADRSNSKLFFDRIMNYGFGAKTASGVPGESAGFLRPAARWSARSKPTISMGQEIAVSAMQMLKAATAVATDGTIHPPKLVSRIVTKDGTLVRDYSAGEEQRIMKAETARMMRSFMRDVTSGSGTGRRAYIEDIPLAVKTGTAEIIDPATGAYSGTDFMASCMAMLPEDEPVLVLYITIFKPKGEYLGGRIAAPYIRETAEQIVNYLGIPRGRNPQYSHAPTVILPENEVPVVGAYVPDFTGYSKRQLLPLLLRDDILVEFWGDGWVRFQTPAPGEPVTEGMTLRLDFE